MKYMLLILGEESQYVTWSKQDRAGQMQRWTDYTEELVAAGAFVAGEGLQTSTTATTLRVQDGERLLTDGPFAETKEQIGGFYVIECRDLDQAIDWAAKLPSAENGTTEIRPVMGADGPDATDPQAAREGAAS